MHSSQSEDNLSNLLDSFNAQYPSIYIYKINIADMGGMEIIIVYSSSRINLEGQLNINSQVSAYNKSNNSDLFVDFRFEENY